MKEKIGTIYTAINLINGKPYVGFTSRWPIRMQIHKRDAFDKKLKDYNSPFHRAIRKYGVENFRWKVLYQSKDQQHTLQMMESQFINEYDSLTPNGYNLCKGGGGTLGLKHSEQTKQKISNSKKGKPGHKQTKTTKQKISSTLKGGNTTSFKLGFKWSDKIKQKMSDSKKGHFVSESTKQKLSKNWLITFPNGNQKEIQNLNQFCRDNNFPKYAYSSLKRVVDGTLNSYHGLKIQKVSN